MDRPRNAEVLPQDRTAARSGRQARRDRGSRAQKGRRGLMRTAIYLMRVALGGFAQESGRIQLDFRKIT